MHCLYIRQAALGNSQANLHCSGLHCLYIRQAALGNSQANLHCPRLHCLYIRQAALGNSQVNLHCSRLHCLFIKQAALGNSQVNLHCPRLHCLCRDRPTRQARGCRHGQLRPAKLRHLSQTGHHNHHLLHFIGVKTACHCCPQGGMSPNRRLPTCAVMRHHWPACRAVVVFPRRPLPLPL